MKYKTFQEYIDTNKKLVEKPKVKKVADYTGKVVSKPEKEKMHKHAGGKGPVGEPASYISGTNGQNPNKDDPKALGHKGMKNLQKKSVSEWINETKNLSMAEFTKDLTNNECRCQIHDLAKDVIESCKCNKENVSTLVRAVKRSKIFESFLLEMLSHDEALKILAKIAVTNEHYSKRLLNTINEMVATPIGFGPDVEGDESEYDSENEPEEDSEEGSEEDSEEGSEEDSEDAEYDSGEDSEEGSEEDSEDAEYNAEEDAEEDAEEEDEGEEGDDSGKTYHHHHHHHHHHHNKNKIDGNFDSSVLQ